MVLPPKVELHNLYEALQNNDFAQANWILDVVPLEDAENFMFLTAEFSYIEGLQMLQRRGVDLKQTTRVGENLLFAVCQGYSKYECVVEFEKVLTAIEFLAAQGLNLKDEDKFGYNALLTCAMGNKIDLFKYFAESKSIDIGSVDCGGRNSLHLACLHSNSIEIVKYLIEELQFDLNSRDENGNTALHYAFISNYDLGFVPYLIDHGANPFLENNNYYNPYELAVQTAEDLNKQLKEIQYEMNPERSDEIVFSDIVPVLQNENLKELFEKIKESMLDEEKMSRSSGSPQSVSGTTTPIALEPLCGHGEVIEGDKENLI